MKSNNKSVDDNSDNVIVANAANTNTNANTAAATQSSIWWKQFQTKFLENVSNLVPYSETQKYSLFDNEIDEITATTTIGNNQRHHHGGKYGSTAAIPSSSSSSSHTSMNQNVHHRPNGSVQKLGQQQQQYHTTIGADGVTTTTTVIDGALFSHHHQRQQKSLNEGNLNVNGNNVNKTAIIGQSSSSHNYAPIIGDDDDDDDDECTPTPGPALAPVSSLPPPSPAAVLPVSHTSALNYTTAFGAISLNDDDLDDLDDVGDVNVGENRDGYYDDKINRRRGSSIGSSGSGRSNGSSSNSGVTKFTKSSSSSISPSSPPLPQPPPSSTSLFRAISVALKYITANNPYDSSSASKLHGYSAFGNENDNDNDDKHSMTKTANYNAATISTGNIAKNSEYCLFSAPTLHHNHSTFHQQKSSPISSGGSGVGSSEILDDTQQWNTYFSLKKAKRTTTTTKQRVSVKFCCSSLIMAIVSLILLSTVVLLLFDPIGHQNKSGVEAFIWNQQVLKKVSIKGANVEYIGSSNDNGNSNKNDDRVNDDGKDGDINGKAGIKNVGSSGSSGGGGGQTKLPPAAVITSRRMCQTDACREAGKHLYNSINHTVDPCDDFFEYACGNWVQNHPIPKDKTRIGTFALLDDQLTENMRTVLEKAYNRTEKVVAGTKTNKKNTNKVASDSRSVQYAADLYRECMDRETIDSLGYKPVQEQLNQLLGFEWPILELDSAAAVEEGKKSSKNLQQKKSKESNSNWIDLFTRFYTLGIAPILTYGVQPDANQTKTKRIYFDSPGFGLGRKEYSNQTAYEFSVKAYKKYLEQVMQLFANGGDSKTVDSKILNKRMEEIFEFESKLALSSTPPEERRSAEVWYNRMTLAEFSALTERRMDWQEFLMRYIRTANVTYVLTNDDLVIVEDKPYYQKMTALLDETPDYIIYNYMGWMFAKKFSKYTTGKLYELSFEHQKSIQGVQQQLPVWKRCISQVYGQLSWAISRLYVDEYVTKATKQAATQLIKDLKQSFRQVVQEDSWLDEVTRERALDKLEGIRENIAYPEWILDDAELDDYYGFNVTGDDLRVTPGKYLQSMLDIDRFSMYKMYRDLPKPVNLTTEWPMPPAMVNAAYAPTQNSITIPVGILRPPFFDAGRPVALNYGGIGSVIGHEITHGFDDQGQQFGKTGNLQNWWTDATQKSFKEGAKCFVKQYGSIVDGMTGKNLNGINTVGENIADNGGVREAYIAFKHFSDHNPNQANVPYMTRFSAEQLFFLSYANIWCGQWRPQSLRIAIDYDPHSPLRYRVNVPLANFGNFAKAFNCPVGSRMNPTDKCSLW